jgi:hypothetical protein
VGRVGRASARLGLVCVRERVSRWLSIGEDANRIHLMIRARPLWPMVALSLVMLCGLGGFLAASGRWLLDDLTGRGHRQEAFASLALFLTGLIAVFYAARLGWRALLSREVLSFDSSTLSLRRGALLLTRPEQFSLQQMRRLRAAPEVEVLDGHAGANPWRFVEGRNVAFDYGPRTVRFGLRVGEEEARAVVEAIRRRAAISDVPFSYRSASDHSLTDDVPAPRATVDTETGHLRITIPSRRSLLYAAACALAAIVVLAFLFSTLPRVPERNLKYLLGLGYVLLHLQLARNAIRAALWSLYGREEIIFGEAGSLSVIVHFGLTQSRSRYPLSEMRGFQVSIVPGAVQGGHAALTHGSVRANCTYGYFRFGLGLDEAEAEAIVRLLTDRLSLIRGSATPPQSV